MAKGDHIVVNRGGYEHHGVDLGDGTVVHFNRESRFGRGSKVRRTSRWMFARGNTVHVETKPSSGRAEEAVELAKRLIGQRGYNVRNWNCEHLATSVVTGVPQSRQIDRLLAEAKERPPVLVPGWAISEFVLRLGRTIRERIAAREYLTKYSILWVGDLWIAPDSRQYAVARSLHWVTFSPGGLVAADNPGAAKLDSRLWMDPLQTVFVSARTDRFRLVGNETTIDLSEKEIPERIGAPIPTLLRNSDSIFSDIERHGMPTPQAWHWPN